jgi:hypothetical protein
MCYGYLQLPVAIRVSPDTKAHMAAIKENISGLRRIYTYFAVTVFYC